MHGARTARSAPSPLPSEEGTTYKVLRREQLARFQAKREQLTRASGAGGGGDEWGLEEVGAEGATIQDKSNWNHPG